MDIFKFSYTTLILLYFLTIGLCNCGELRKNFYRKSCPHAEKIVRDITWKHVAINSSLPAKFLRMHFHDCFVRGCDASILLDSTANNTAEKDSIPNNSLTGYEVIDEIKSKLEHICPGKVSCADILALVARDSVSFQIKKSTWKVLTGRRDGVVSRASETLVNIPSPFSNFATLKQSFANKSLTVKDLVLLSGAHSIGLGHCNLFSKRLYNFTGKGDADPLLDPSYAALLRSRCRGSSDNTTAVEMDPGSSLIFDNRYFSTVLQRKGLFQSDAALLTNDVANGIVTEMVDSGKFLTEFRRSMKRMGAVGVLTGNAGEIRKKCRVVN